VTGSGSYINCGGGVFKSVNHTNSIDNIKPSAIQVYPNPNKNGIVQIAAQHIAYTELTDILGRNVTHIFNDNALDFSGAPSGTYLLKVYFENGTNSVVKLQKI